MFRTIVQGALPLSSSDARDPVRAPTGGARDTKQRLLDAAERLFAEHGFEGTSMRAVARDAGTSVSAAHYHFGSKEALLRRALQRRIEPLNRRRLENLDAAERLAGEAPVELERLVEAFLRPAFDADREAGADRAPFRQLAAQLYSDPHATMTALKLSLFEPVARRFVEALARALPDRSHEELGLDLQFVIGVMIHTITGHARGEAEGEDVPAVADEDLLRRMVCFTAAGLRAKSAAPAARTHGGADR
jgi:AcrR family transcriptional regulator